MRASVMDIINITPYENNPRLISDRAVEMVAMSIKEYGFNSPIIVDGNNVIINGHTRYKAAIKLGLKKVPVVVADDLTEEQVRAFRIADNRVSEFAKWDYKKLQEEFEDLKNALYQLDTTGFLEYEIDSINLEFNSVAVSEEIEEAIEYYECPNCGYVGPMDEFLEVEDEDN